MAQTPIRQTPRLKIKIKISVRQVLDAANFLGFSVEHVDELCRRKLLAQRTSPQPEFEERRRGVSSILEYLDVLFANRMKAIVS